MKISLNQIKKIIKEEVEITDDGIYIERLPEGNLARPLDPKFLQNEKKIILPLIDQKINAVMILIKEMQEVRRKLSSTNDINEFEDHIRLALLGKFPKSYKKWFDAYEARVESYNKKNNKY